MSVIVSPAIVIPTSNYSDEFVLHDGIILPRPLKPVVTAASPNFASESVPYDAI